MRDERELEDEVFRQVQRELDLEETTLLRELPHGHRAAKNGDAPPAAHSVTVPTVERCGERAAPLRAAPAQLPAAGRSSTGPASIGVRNTWYGRSRRSWPPW